jgi:hypothetical protein
MPPIAWNPPDCPVLSYSGLPLFSLGEQDEEEYHHGYGAVFVSRVLFTAF